jgi:hypothetical protein
MVNAAYSFWICIEVEHGHGGEVALEMKSWCKLSFDLVSSWKQIGC